MLEETTRPPTPLAAEILAMVLRPLDSCSASEAGPGLVTSGIMLQLCEHFLARPLTDQVRVEKSRIRFLLRHEIKEWQTLSVP